MNLIPSPSVSLVFRHLFKIPQPILKGLDQHNHFIFWIDSWFWFGRYFEMLYGGEVILGL